MLAFLTAFLVIVAFALIFLWARYWVGRTLLVLTVGLAGMLGIVVVLVMLAATPGVGRH